MISPSQVTIIKFFLLATVSDIEASAYIQKFVILFLVKYQNKNVEIKDVSRLQIT